LDQSVERFGLAIGTDIPDLTAFRDRRGKGHVWHSQSIWMKHDDTLLENAVASAWLV